LVTDGCAVELTNAVLQGLIAPDVSDDGKSMSYNQFGFVDSSDNMVLTFELSCTVKIGTNPSCDSGNEGRSNDSSSDTVAATVTQTVTVDENGNGKRVKNLVVSGNNAGSSAAAIFASTTLAAGLATLL